ncbi:KilA-N DNA-binding domain-containing protein [uncultured virus]|nr:KilA-N DNA-binding domain-containing protein [uncultured virus]
MERVSGIYLVLLGTYTELSDSITSTYPFTNETQVIKYGKSFHIMNRVIAHRGAYVSNCTLLHYRKFNIDQLTKAEREFAGLMQEFNPICTFNRRNCKEILFIEKCNIPDLIKSLDDMVLLGELDVTIQSFDHLNLMPQSRYISGYYDKYPVIIDTVTGFVNATKLCISISNHAVRFDHWINQQITVRKIQQLEDQNKDVIKQLWLDDPVNANVTWTEELTTTKEYAEYKKQSWSMHVNGNQHTNQISGSYIHCGLISHLIMWYDPVFSMKVSSILDKMFLHEINELKQEITTKDNTIIAKDNTITTLEAKVDQLLKESRESRNKLESAVSGIKKNTKLLKQSKQDNANLTSMTQELVQSNREIKTIALSVARTSVTNKHVNVSNYMALLKLTLASLEVDYKIIRTQLRSKSRSINEASKDYATSETLFETQTPNAILLWDEVKRKLQQTRKIEVFSRWDEEETEYITVFQFTNGMTEELFIDLLKKTHGDRLKPIKTIRDAVEIVGD